MACGQEAQTIHVTWPDVELEVFGLAVVQGGRLVRVEGPLGLSTGAIRFGPSAIELEDGDGEVYLFGLTPDQLAAISSIIDRSALPERAELFGDQETCSPARLSEDGRSLRTSLPSDSTRLVLNRQAGRFEPIEMLPEPLFDVGFALPVDFDLCLTDALPQSRAYGRQARYFGNSTTILGQPIGDVSAKAAERLVKLAQVERLDERWLLAMSERVIYLLERDGLYEDLEHRRVAASELPVLGGIGTWAFRQFAVDPTSPPGGPTRILAAAARVSGNTSPGGALAELVVDQDEIRFVRTATAFEGDGTAIKALTFESDGSFIAVGNSGLVVTGTSASATETDTFRIDGFEAASLEEVVSTEMGPDRHFIGTGQGVIAVGDARRGRTGFHQEDLESIATHVVDLMVRDAGFGPQVWAATYSDGFFSRGLDGTWSEASLKLHPSARACAGNSDSCGRRDVSEALDAMITSPSGSVILTSDFCTAIFEYAPDRLCGEPIVIEGDSIQATPGQSFAALHRFGRWVTVAGSSGRVIELQWPE